jgi:hypothetical protein
MGIVGVIGPLIAGGLALWANTYVNDQVQDQLAAQKITFFAAQAVYPCAAGVKSEDCFPQYASRKQYSGQMLTTGAKAEAYADTQILNDLNAMTGGQTYAQLSAKAMTQPTNTALQGQVAGVFKGATLRGLLLNAYAFGTIATIAGWAALAAIIGAALLVALSVLGFTHGTGKLGRTSAQPRASA